MQGLLGLASGDRTLLLTHSLPQFPHLQNVDNNSTAFDELLELSRS